MSLRELRQKRGYSQEDLGEKSGVTREIISKYERGIKPIENMTLGTAIKLCDALRVSNPRKLLEAEKPKESDAD